MAKVKTGPGVTGVRNATGKKRVKPVTALPARKARRSATAGATTKATARAKQKRKAARSPVIRVAVRALDPQRKCGTGTSVQRLYRVDETIDGRATAHLVFYDRHGWYCEHGRTCPAVGHARKHRGQLARVS